MNFNIDEGESFFLIIELYLLLLLVINLTEPRLFLLIYETGVIKPMRIDEPHQLLLRSPLLPPKIILGLS